MVRSIALSLLLAASACAQELTVDAPSSMRGVLPLIAADFERSRSGVHITVNVASSGMLEQQIEHGAPVDVFISAAPIQMDSLQHLGFIDSTTRRIVCGNELVLIAAPGTALHDWKGLGGDNVRRIAMGDPATVPAGMYAQQSLKFYQVWDLVTRKLTYADDVEKVLGYVDGGNVDAGIVYRTDALVAKRAVIVATAQADAHLPVTYPAAVVTRSAHKDVASAFVTYLATVGQATLQAHGFATNVTATK